MTRELPPKTHPRWPPACPYLRSSANRSQSRLRATGASNVHKPGAAMRGSHSTDRRQFINTLHLYKRMCVCCVMHAWSVLSTHPSRTPRLGVRIIQYGMCAHHFTHSHTEMVAASTGSGYCKSKASLLQEPWASCKGSSCNKGAQNCKLREPSIDMLYADPANSGLTTVNCTSRGGGPARRPRALVLLLLLLVWLVLVVGV